MGDLQAMLRSIIFQMIEPTRVESCFRAWTEQIRQDLGVEIIALDGKSGLFYDLRENFLRNAVGGLRRDVASQAPE